MEPGSRPTDAEGPDAARPGADALKDALREAFACWATGVTVITVMDETGVHGLTASAFTPVSLDPPLVLVCVGNDTPILTHLLDAGRFTANILAEEQKRAANTFSDRYAVALPPFRAGDDAVIEAALASVICTLDSDLEAGDHRILIGRVTRVEEAPGRRPLLRFRRAYRSIA